MSATNTTRIEPLPAPLDGAARVPGDKSISHRAVLFSAMAEGTSRLTGVLDSADVRSTIGAVSALGAKVSLPELKFCGDNGAMIAAQGYYQYIAGHTAGLELNGLPTLPIDYE